MKKVFLNVLVCTFLLCTVFLTSCFTYTSVVGDGAKGNQKEKKWNHYLIGGLIPVSTSDSKAMAGGAKDYTVTTKFTFVNLLVGGITFGIYTPTTTTVKK
ncbi:MAG: Bor family protein [Bacteroidia bacterium]|nr:Bor family protein [Bacteroidia bacterium]